MDLISKIQESGYSFNTSVADFYNVRLGVFYLCYLPKIKGREWRLYHSHNLYERLLIANEAGMLNELIKRGILK